MNRKGFTLIEVIAVIVILGIILVIGAPSILKVYENSKLKSEQIFINRLSTVIDSYVKLNTDTIEFKFEGYTEKGEEENIRIERGTITIEDIVKDNLLSKEDYINAGNKGIQCEEKATIEVYRDSDFVYCHKVAASSLECITENYIKSICNECDDTVYVINTCVWDGIY